MVETIDLIFSPREAERLRIKILQRTVKDSFTGCWNWKGFKLFYNATFS